MQKTIPTILALTGVLALLAACSSGGGTSIRIENWPSGQTGRAEFYLGNNTTAFA
ncbi:hypothetical protein [Meiothermus sp. QL-1]|uniref:hypothetical protein n=1 Tax=Meiothermus sp. QL-1 TaxID=2058095 RepID=UPI001314D038|nr:hypothetical protein [Meiothermus sp. QL-1]